MEENMDTDVYDINLNQRLFTCLLGKYEMT